MDVWTAHAEQNNCHFEIYTKPPKCQKGRNAVLDAPVLNYSNYEYLDSLECFSEHDRLMKNELSGLEWYDEYELKKPLHSFEDHALNNHLYRVYYSNKMETTLLMRWWISYFACQHHKQITIKVKDYINSKMLSLDDWLHCVNKDRRGDILCVSAKYCNWSTHYDTP